MWRNLEIWKHLVGNVTATNSDIINMVVMSVNTHVADYIVFYWSYQGPLTKQGGGESLYDYPVIWGYHKHNHLHNPPGTCRGPRGDRDGGQILDCVFIAHAPSEVVNFRHRWPMLMWQDISYRGTTQTLCWSVYQA